MQGTHWKNACFLLVVCRSVSDINSLEREIFVKSSANLFFTHLFQKVYFSCEYQIKTKKWIYWEKEIIQFFFSLVWICGFSIQPDRQMASDEGFFSQKMQHKNDHQTPPVLLLFNYHSRYKTKNVILNCSVHLMKWNLVAMKCRIHELLGVTSRRSLHCSLKLDNTNIQ